MEGGNHAQFGNYGEQKGDGKATISAEEQQRQTVKLFKKIPRKVFKTSGEFFNAKRLK